MPQIEGDIESWEGKRYFYGFSNGAAFCLYIGINYPESFEEIIAFSTVDYISEFASPIELIFQNYPKFYLGAGRYEESIFHDNVTFVSKLKSNGIYFDFKEFIAGHDYYVWQIEFLEYLKKRFER